MRPRLLLLEDDLALAEATVAYLQGAGFEVDHHVGGNGVVASVLNTPPDILVLDIEVPGESGLSICARVRNEFEGPIVILTGRSSDMDEIIGLELGAEAYLTKPVNPRVLVLRLQALLRRGASTPSQVCHRDRDLTVDRRARAVTVGTEDVELTTGEFELLWLLVHHLGSAVSRDLYYEQIRGVPYDGEDRTMDARMSIIRRKLVDAGFPDERLKTVRSVGYQLAPAT